ncbi:ATPase [Candidatus Haloredivivus sp. G17]|nr:ATPase [Candidatus Haloredivivus sp. G17]
MKIVPDTSAIIDGKLMEEIDQGLEAEIIIPEFVVDEVENQANKGLEIGFTGIEEIRRLREKASENEGISVEFTGRKPSMEEINLASSGRIDALIRDVAEEIDATLYTADIVQSKIAEAKGIEVVLIEKEDAPEELDIEKYFDDETMSIHLTQDARPKAKRGMPGNFKLENIGDDLMEKEELEDLIHNIMDVAENSEKGLIEMEGDGATVVQYGRYRIAMTRPPFSSAAEITAVRPVAKVGLDDYDLSEKLIQRLDQKAEGILVAGAPGHGKSTFAQALAEHYEDKNQVVKTMEKPRDLDVGPDITQYTALDESMENTGDFLLLVRPDFTVFDEVRRTSDFEVFSDMRMAGVGMIGIVHASEAVDAVQRLIGRVELGMIPQVCDTVIFIENAEVAEVYELEMVVKVPEGMVEEDLARPVVQIRKFEDSKPVYEVYTYGEETVVIPVNEREESGAEKLAKEQIEHFLRGRVDNPQIEFISDNHIKMFVQEDEISQVIGKGGENIDELERDLGLNITVEPKSQTLKSEVDFDIDESGNSINIEVSESLSGKEVDVYDGDEFLFTATVGKSGTVSLTKDSDLAGRILSAYSRDRLNLKS